MANLVCRKDYTMKRLASVYSLFFSSLSPPFHFHVCGVHVCLYICGHTYVWVLLHMEAQGSCWDQPPSSLTTLPLYQWRQRLSVNPEPPDIVSLASLLWRAFAFTFWGWNYRRATQPDWHLPEFWSKLMQGKPFNHWRISPDFVLYFFFFISVFLVCLLRHGLTM